MTLVQLKEAILENTISDDFLILQCSDNHFLAEQYVQNICSCTQKLPNNITSLFEVQDSAFALVFDYDERINILKVEEFNEQVDDYSRFRNTIVICDKIDKKISQRVAEYVVNIPKLQDWQVLAYMQQICTGLEQHEYQKLYDATNGNIYRIQSELEKLSLFPEEERSGVLYAMLNEKGTDLYYSQIFTITDAIYKKNMDYLLGWLRHINQVDVEPVGLVTILLGNFKKVAYFVLNCGKTPEEVGCTPKQAAAIKYNYKGYTEKQIIPLIDFLSNIDTRLKSGEIEMSKQSMLIYILSHILLYII